MLGDSAPHGVHRLEARRCPAGRLCNGEGWRGRRGSGAEAEVEPGGSWSRLGRRRGSPAGPAPRPAPAEQAPERLTRRGEDVLVTRPPRPVPETWFTSTPCSEASWRPPARRTSSRPCRRSGQELSSRSRRAGAASTVSAVGVSPSGSTEPPPRPLPERSRGRGASSAGEPLPRPGFLTSAPSGRSPRASSPPRPSLPPGRGSAANPPGLGTSVSTLSVEISSSDSSEHDRLAHLLEPLRDRPLGNRDASGITTSIASSRHGP
jgi:hypothetical protein